LAFNGEIYNHNELRAQLDKAGPHRQWKGHSDTETLLSAFSCWGIEQTLKSISGMFAFALWDNKKEVLTLARDRLGEKPLYYGWQNGVFLYGSELKAFKRHPEFSAKIDRGALALLLRHNCVPSPYSIYIGISKLKPGHFLQLAPAHRSQCINPESAAYWTLQDAAESGMASPFQGTESEAVELVEEQLKASVRLQMVADVPLGAFLSGGIDSSIIVALMQAQSDRPINTYTIGSANSDYDEAVYAKEVAKHLGTEHTELYVTADDAMAVIPKLPSMYCEPFSDSSQIPTYLVSALASEHVKVALSGDGGDELFGGYNRYAMAQAVWQRMQRVPLPVRKGIAKCVKSLNVEGWDRLFNAAENIVPNRFRVKTPGEKAHKLTEVLLAEDGVAYYRTLVSHWKAPADVIFGATEHPTLLDRPEHWPKTGSFVEWMMAIDTLTYMTDDILTKVDRAAMANSLETRVPFLDHRVVELAWRIPLSMKIRNGEGKWLLRQILGKYVPRQLVDRPKMGFGSPLHEWLRGPLRDWAEELLSVDRLRQEGYFDPVPIRRLWDAHLSGKANEQYLLWDVLMFQAWLAEQ
jgi:asparagine synthase (glutamine-hydrolysing)